MTENDGYISGEMKVEYMSVSETAKRWGLTDRAVRKYCSDGKIRGTFMIGKTWNIPSNALPPERKNARRFSDNDLLNVLKFEKDNGIKGGIYHKVQIKLTYNSSSMESSKLTEDQTRTIFEINRIFTGTETNIDDIIETANHFRCIDHVIDNAKKALTQKMIKELHLMLKNGTADSRMARFKIGDYKLRPNEVGGQETCAPAEVAGMMKDLLEEYNAKEVKKIDDIVDFYQRFKKIYPFQDGNGRVGHLIMFKECLANNIVPFVIDEEHRLFRYRGRREGKSEKEILMDICLFAQDKFRDWLRYFAIKE